MPIGPRSGSGRALDNISESQSHHCTLTQYRHIVWSNFAGALPQAPAIGTQHMAKIKAGIIGTGFIGPAHVEALRRLGFVEVAGVAERGEELAKAKAEQMSIPKAYGDYRKM